MPTKRKSAASGDRGDAHESDSFDNPRFDEILALLSRQPITVLDRTLDTMWDKESLEVVDKPTGLKVGDRKIAVDGDVQWQVEVRESVWGSARTKLKSAVVGTIDLVIPFVEMGRTKDYGNVSQLKRRLMVICRPVLRSAADAIKTLNQLSERRTDRDWRETRGDSEEVWAIATDNDSMRDIFEANGYKYICTRWDDIDGWGRTDSEQTKRVFTENEEDQRWVVVQTDIGGVSTTIVPKSRSDAVAAFLQRAYLFVHAFPSYDFMIHGNDRDAALEGMRLLMRVEVKGVKSEHWMVPLQLCKAMGVEFTNGAPKECATMAEAGFTASGAEMSRLLKGIGERLDQGEVQRLAHSWPALLFWRGEMVDGMAKEAAKVADGKRQASETSREVWQAMKTVESFTVTTAVIH
jgi:hypothetical protein